MNALVTGSAGFIGRHMVRELEARGWNVVGHDIEGSYLRGRFRRNFTIDAHEIFRESNELYDLVVHCAYNVGGRAAIDGVNTNFAKNLQLDAAMFEWAVRTNQKHVLYFSSSAAYPFALQRLGGHRLQESDVDFNGVYAGTPDANYGWAKLTGERLAADARKSGLAVSVVRPFSGYGEDQSLDYPFPSIVARAQAGDLSVWGPPGQSRDWIHVSDVINGSLAVVADGTPEPVNLCTGRATEMGALAQSIYLAAHDHIPELLYPNATYDESKPTGVFYRVGDPTRMLKYYTPKVSLAEGIDRALSRSTNG